MITELKPKEIFVFGSNLEGNHAGGAALQSKEFGAIDGVGVGMAGNTYAIPTMGSFAQLRNYVRQFELVATYMPKYTFLLTPIGCGIAGYKPDRIARLFIGFPDNVILPKEFLKALEGLESENTD